MNEFPLEDEPLDVTEIRQVRRITLAQVFRSAFDAFNVDRGGVYTIKSLLKNPGEAIVDYLGANRYHYTPPFRILLITTAIALFLLGISDFTNSLDTKIALDIQNEVKTEEEAQAMVQEATFELFDDIKPYSNLILWTFIPVIALFTYLINLKKRFNYAEHLVFQTYLFCIANLLSFIFPLDHYVPVWLVLSVIYAFMTVYYIYGYKVFLSKSWIRSILEMILILIFSSMLWSVILGILFGMVLSLKLNGIL